MEPTLGIDGRLANMSRRAGVGNYCLGMLAGLAEAAPGLPLRVYLDAPPRPDFPALPPQASLRVLPPGRYWTQRILARELRRDPPDVFWSPVLQLPMVPACPAIATVHDLAYLGFPGEFTWRRRVLARIQMRQALYSARHLIAVSQATRADLIRHYRVDPARITVTLEGASPQFVPERDPEAVARVRQAHGLPGRFVLYVGRLQPRKNLGRLIQAFAGVLARRPELPHHLVIAGDQGWLYDAIYKAARRSPARDRIRFLGFVPDPELPALMAAADLLVLVSLWEGFGLPVVEAMACSTPVLTSNVSSLPEVAGDATALVDPADTGAIGDALERLLTDDAARLELGRRGPAQAARFTWRAAADRLLEAVRAVAG